MTFSLLAKCSKTGMFGAVITTSSIAVGARCPYVRAKTGAVSSQNITDPRLGPRLLDALDQHQSAQKALDEVLTDTPNLDYRQLLLIDRQGDTAHFSGANILGIHHVYAQKNAIAAGNLLKHKDVPEAMVERFCNLSDLALPERLILSIQSGLDCGGEMGPLHSSALLIADQDDFELVNLRVDWHDRPLTELARLWELYAPQMQDYRNRALNPQIAPSYGVPGDT
ncbi:MAG: DUF1028 domain-containing protein [Pseudomonadota bacterium]